MRPGAVNVNRNSAGLATSVDYGVMQVNSSHIPELVSLGVIHDKNDLLTRPCLNVQVGAWILARFLRQCGNTWGCLGAYNAGLADGRERRRLHYASEVHRLYQRLSRRTALSTQGLGGDPTAAAER